MPGKNPADVAFGDAQLTGDGASGFLWVGGASGNDLPFGQPLNCGRTAQPDPLGAGAGEPGMDALLDHWNQFGEPKMTARTPEQLARFLDGLEMVEPGMVPVSQWRPDLGETKIEGGIRPEADPLGAVGRKP